MERFLIGMDSDGIGDDNVSDDGWERDLTLGGVECPFFDGA